jgi:DUF971 family protein
MTTAQDFAALRIPEGLLPVRRGAGSLAGPAKLQIGKEQVNINDLQQIGSYAVKIVFDDGHKSGLYDWQYLYKLGRAWQPLWLDYLIGSKALVASAPRRTRSRRCRRAARRLNSELPE